jgi:hypothetical protein
MPELIGDPQAARFLTDRGFQWYQRADGALWELAATATAAAGLQFAKISDSARFPGSRPLGDVDGPVLEPAFTVLLCDHRRLLSSGFMATYSSSTIEAALWVEKLLLPPGRNPSREGSVRSEELLGRRAGPR